MKKIQSSILFVIVSLCLFLSCDRGDVLLIGADTITIEDLKRDMVALASPATEGRLTGSPGYRKAADYTVELFRRYGLKPGWRIAGEEASFLQPVPFIRCEYGAGNSLFIEEGGISEILQVGGNNFEPFYPGQGNEQILPDNPVFIGYGIHEPELGWDDFAGNNIEGKVVILMIGLPAFSSG